MIEKAKTLLEDSSYCENGMADTMRQRAAIYAQLAIAEEIRKLHDLLATHFGFASIEPDDDEIDDYLSEQNELQEDEDQSLADDDEIAF